MREIRRIAVLTAVLCLLAEDAALACGDKLVVLGRGVRFERIHRAKNPGQVVLYLNPDSKMPLAEADFHLSASLELAGHTVVTAASRDELERILAGGEADVVLADLADLRALAKRGSGEADEPLFVPVLYKPTDEELAEAAKLSSCTSAAARRRTRTLFTTVDDLIGQRRAGVADACGPKKGKGTT
jgi:hypothetical protein